MDKEWIRAMIIPMVIAMTNPMQWSKLARFLGNEGILFFSLDVRRERMFVCVSRFGSFSESQRTVLVD